MERKDKVLSQRLNLHYFQTDKFKTNYISVNFIMPLKKETAASEALLLDVLARGTEKYPTMRDINTHLDDCYGMSVNTECTKNGTMHIFGCSVGMLSNKCVYDGTDLTAAAIDMLDQLLFHPLTEDGLLRRDYTEQEKEKLCERIEDKFLRKPRYAIDRCNEAMFEGETLGIPEHGTCEDVRTITPESLTECYRNVLGNARIELFCVGEFTEEQLFALGEVFLNGANADAGSLPCEYEKVTVKAPTEVRRKTEVKQVAQATMAMGFRLDRTIDSCDETADLVLFNAIFGSGATSKLFMNVREKMSLCYFCQSMCSLRSGVMYVVTGVDLNNIEKTELAVLDQLRQTAENNITDKETEFAKMGIRNNLLAVYDSPSAIESWYLGRMLAGKVSSPEEELEKILAVTSEDVARAVSSIKLDTVFVLRGNAERQADGDDE